MASTFEEHFVFLSTKMTRTTRFIPKSYYFGSPKKTINYVHCGRFVIGPHLVRKGVVILILLGDLVARLDLGAGSGQEWPFWA